MVSNMAFDNINVSSLKNALVQCKNSIDYSTTEELINNISNTSIWQSSSQTNLKNALIKLKDERYQELEEKINNYLEATSYIERYQDLEKENVSLNREYSSLSRKLYYNETYTETTKNSDGTLKKETRTQRVKDKSVERQMTYIERKIEANTRDMENFKNIVSNYIK